MGAPFLICPASASSVPFIVASALFSFSLSARCRVSHRRDHPHLTLCRESPPGLRGDDDRTALRSGHRRRRLVRPPKTPRTHLRPSSRSASATAHPQLVPHCAE